VRVVHRLVMPLLVVMACLIAADAAGAATPTNGTSVPGSAVPVGTHIAGIPFSSGQQINVVMPANSLFIPTTSVNIVECAAPNGVLPSLPDECDGNTIQGGTVFPDADGSINLSADGEGLFPVYALPDSAFGEGASSGVTCGDTAATECVLYVGENQGDFAQPHLWSQPFYVLPVPGDNGTPVGDGSPPPPPMPPSAASSTVVASPATGTADGTDISTVTVTLVESGNVPGAGKSVSLERTGHATISPATSVTDANGVARFSVTDATTEKVTLTAADITDSPPVVLAAQPTVDFEAPAVNDANSTVVPTSPVVNPGSSTTITVTLRDQGSPPRGVAGQTVELVATGGNGNTVTISPPSGETDSSGIAVFKVSDTAAETVTFTATDLSDGDLPLFDMAAVIFGFASSAVPVGPYTAGTTPFTSGQTVNIVVAANHVLPANTSLDVVECSAPDGAIPTSPAACDGNTIQGPQLESNADGSVNFQTYTQSPFSVVALPDLNLGETPGSGPQCGDTTATECIICIGDNHLDFTQPHVWSQPFVAVADSNDNGEPAGDGTLGSPPAATPEVASVVALPAVAFALIAAAVSVQTRRRKRRPRDIARPLV
jgi:Bacterial Ig-like domain (group 1)